MSSIKNEKTKIKTLNFLTPVSERKHPRKVVIDSFVLHFRLPTQRLAKCDPKNKEHEMMCVVLLPILLPKSFHSGVEELREYPQ